MLTAAPAHRGAAFVEIYQNCNVFNDGAFEEVTGKADPPSRCSSRSSHGEPIRFGADGEKGVMMGNDGAVRVVDVAEVGEANLLVHDETDAGLAFQLSRLSHGPHEPTPIGVFRSVDRARVRRDGRPAAARRRESRRARAISRPS